MAKCEYCHGDMKTKSTNQVVFRSGKGRRRTTWCPVCNWDKLMTSEKAKYRHIRGRHQKKATPKGGNMSKNNKCYICGEDIGTSTIHLRLTPKGHEIGPLCKDCRDRLTTPKGKS